MCKALCCTFRPFLFQMAKNSFFNFKQFSIHQDKCAMKVTLDACLFGAWITLAKGSRCLDIGTGTGLLALMLAQKFEVTIDAIEIDKASSLQANSNFDTSPFGKRIHCCHSCLQKFSISSDFSDYYDFIISNPPFYHDQIKPNSNAKRLAWHDDELDLKDILQASEKMLDRDGSLYLMLPLSAKNRLETIMSDFDFYFEQICYLKSFADSSPHRLFLKLKCNPADTSESEIVIYQKPKHYTSMCKALLQPYFLSL